MNAPQPSTAPTAAQEQEQILNPIIQVICERRKASGASPSQQELADACFISRTTLIRYLAILEGAGRIERTPGTHRNLTVLEPCPEDGPN